MNTRISVKGIKEFKELSDDSIAFSCTVLFDGVAIAKASDNGNGGAIRFDRLGESGKLCFAKAPRRNLQTTTSSGFVRDAGKRKSLIGRARFRG